MLSGPSVSVVSHSNIPAATSSAIVSRLSTFLSRWRSDRTTPVVTPRTRLALPVCEGRRCRHVSDYSKIKIGKKACAGLQIGDEKVLWCFSSDGGSCGRWRSAPPVSSPEISDLTQSEAMSTGRCLWPAHSCSSEPLDRPRALASSGLRPFFSVLLTDGQKGNRREVAERAAGNQPASPSYVTCG